MDLISRLLDRGLSNDKSWGPQYLDKFDFTLEFESQLFNTLPASIIIFVCPLFLLRYRQEPMIAPQTSFMWSKIAVAITLLVLEILRSVLWSRLPEYRTDISIAGTSLSCIAALGIILLIALEQRYSTNSSSFLTVYLTICVLLDAAQTRSMLMRDTDLRPVGVVTAVIASVKLILMILGEVPKRLHNTNNPEAELSQEATGGFWNRTLLVWLNSTLFFGFSNELKMADLADLGPDFSSRRLMDKFNPIWAKSDKQSPHALIFATARALFWPLMAPAIPRIVRSVFGFTGPFLIQRILRNLHETDAPYYVQGGLIAATALTYLGVGLAAVSFMHAGNRAGAFVRGVLVGQVLKKNLSLKASTAKREAALTLMSTDVEGIVENTTQIHSIWMSFFEVGLDLYFLSTLIGNAWFLPAITIAGSFVIAWKIASLNVHAVSVWNASIDRRVSKMSNVLAQIRGIKLMGLESIISDYIHRLRIYEILMATRARQLRVIQVALFPLTYWGTPIAIVAGGLFWTTMKDGLDTSKIFTIMAFIGLLEEPMGAILNFWPNLGKMLACFQRLQEFLLLEARHDPRETRNFNHRSGSFRANEKSVGSDPQNRCIVFLDTTVSNDLGDEILKRINLSIDRGSFVTVAGPVAAGKSMLLRTLLGETSLTHGEVHIAEGGIAYCDQKPWLPDATIQEVIQAETEFDQEWYDKVIHACALHYDFEQLPNGDQTRTGANGTLLSGGQKQRVALARAVLSRAPILVLDDVMSSLDYPTADHLYEHLFSPTGLLKAHGRTVILATHSVRFIYDSDQVIVVDKSGKVTMNTADAAVEHVEENRDLLSPFIKEEVNLNEQAHILRASQDLAFEKAREASKGGDLSLYSYFLGSVPWWQLTLFVIFIALVSFMEAVPLLYLRIWADIDPSNKMYFVGFVLLGVLCMVINGVAAWLFMLVAMPKIGINLHKIFLDSVMKATIPFLTSATNGSLLNRFSQDMTLLSQEMPMAFYGLLYIFFAVITHTGIIAAGATYAGLFIPLTIVLLYLLQMFYLRTSRQLRILDLEAKTPLYAKINESISGLEHIRAFGWEEKVLNDSLELLDHSQKSFYYMFCIQRWLMLVLELFAAFIATILVTMALKWKHTTTQPGLGLALISCLDYSFMIRKLVERWVGIETSLGAVARLRQFVETTPTEEDQPNVKRQPPDWPQEGHIEFTNVSARYNNSSPPHMALENLTFTAAAGEKTALRGRTGSGKTTVLLALLKGVDHTGTLTIDGVDVADVPRDQLRSCITTVTQDPVDIPGTVRNNLLPLDLLKAPGEGTIHDTAIYTILESVGLLEHIHYRGGLDMPIENMEFSYGQKQLLGVARAMLHHLETGSKICVMDEPTSSMDHMTEGNLLQHLREAFHECTRIVVAHRPSGFSDSDVIVTLQDGRISSNLPLRKLLTDGLIENEYHSD